MTQIKDDETFLHWSNPRHQKSNQESQLTYEILPWEFEKYDLIHEQAESHYQSESLAGTQLSDKKWNLWNKEKLKYMHEILDETGITDEIIIKELKNIVLNAEVQWPKWDILQDSKTKLKAIELVLDMKGYRKNGTTINIVNLFQDNSLPTL